MSFYDNKRGGQEHGEHFSNEGSENFSVGVGLSIASPNHHSSRYMADQTFHTPNFGDEEFIDIPPISLQSGHETNHGQSNMSYPMTMVHHGDQHQSQHYAQMYLPEHMNPPMTIHSPVTYGGSPPTYTTLSSPHAPSQSPLGNSHMMHHPQQQQGGRPQSSLMGNPGGGPPGRSPTNSTSPTNPETATSDDSDDSVPLSHSQMAPALKRPSPEPVDTRMSTVTVAPKKAKPQKKKKKRDPNEPQKPVSAYALFFRDTQAAIKGQNPNASFGEVSKIVASMWDALDADHKNVYKKKTEAAKKEYLKALAAYRASLVSKGAPTDSVDGSGMYPPNFNASMAPQQQQPQQHYQPQNYYGNQGGGPANKKVQQQQTQQQSSVNQGPMQHSPQHQQTQQQQQHQQQQNHQMMQQHMIDSNQYGSMRHNAGPYMNSMGDGSHGMGMGSGMHNMQQQQGGGGGHGGPPVMSHMNNDGHSHTHTRGGQVCVRSGCGNTALTSPEWDDEYCSSDCVVTHCRDVFTNWVSNNPGGNPSYHPAAVNKFNGSVASSVIGPDGLSYVT